MKFMSAKEWDKRNKEAIDRNKPLTCKNTKYMTIFIIVMVIYIVISPLISSFYFPLAFMIFTGGIFNELGKYFNKSGENELEVEIQRRILASLNNDDIMSNEEYMKRRAQALDDIGLEEN